MEFSGISLSYIFASLNRLTLKFKNIICGKRTLCFFINIFFIFIFLLYILFKFDIFIKPKGFRASTSNIIFNIFSCTILLLLFGSLKIYKFSYIRLDILIKIITRNTGGIYYIHEIVREYFKINVDFIRKGTYKGSIIIYITSYFICFIGNKTFKNNILKYLFY